MKNLLKVLAILAITIFGGVNLGKALADNEIKLMINNKDALEYVDEGTDLAIKWIEEKFEVIF